jgi:osomolarity two-component system response regulator SKN7
MDLVNSQLMATQQQLQHLSERYQDLAQGHVVLLQQVLQLQKFVKNHDGVMHRVMGFLHSVDAQRRNSRIGGPFGPADGMPNDGPIDDHPASPLQQASHMLEEFPAENLPNKELEQMTHEYNLRADYSTPPNDPSSASMVAQSENTSPHHMVNPFGNDLDSMVYPVGTTNGIDPVNSEHIHNIPYALPANGMMNPTEPMVDMAPEAGGIGRKKSNVESVWGVNKPRILLVEDDKVCARIGSKFLQNFECGVETAVCFPSLSVLHSLTSYQA